MGALKEPVKSLYEQDLAAWAFEQASAVKRGDWRAVDGPNLVEELESMGKQQRAELVARLTVLLLHLLKLDAQPGMTLRHRSWKLSILEQRRQIERHLRLNPSLKTSLDECLQDAFGDARLAAARETRLPLKQFPTANPYTFDAAMERPTGEE